MQKKYIGILCSRILIAAMLTLGVQSMAQVDVPMQSQGGLKYEVRGQGEAILLIHGGFVHDALLPIVNEAVLEHYQLIRYYRRGYGGSEGHEKTFSIVSEAEDALILLASLELDKVHVVGYSAGGVVATELALMAPELVKSLILIEPALDSAVIDQVEKGGFIQTTLELYQSGDRAGAINAFLSAVAGPNWAEDNSSLLPGSVEQINENADLAFQGEIQGVEAYRLPKEKAQQIKQAVLLILSDGFGVNAGYRETLKQWLPQTEEFIVEDANHNLLWKQPGIIAQEIASFIIHPTSIK